MLSHFDRHDLAISSCGVPLKSELLHVCLSHPVPPRLEQALIWLALLHGLDELEQVLATAPAPLALSLDETVGLYAAMHLAGNPAQAAGVLLRLQAVGGATATPQQAMNQVLERAGDSPWVELIRQANMLNLSDPAGLFAQWLGDLERSIAERMPFDTLLRLSILCRSPEKLPGDWQKQLAEAITAIGDLADAIPLYRFWMLACQVCPDWDFACIRAADLALRCEDFGIADHLFKRPERAVIQNPWFYDVKARCRYGYGDLRAAARLWSVALAKVDTAAPERHVFRDRMLAALRGKFGLAEASRLARGGQKEAALQLLRILILNDPGFVNHYTLLAALQEGLEAGECARIDPGGEQLAQETSVADVIERFRPLWLGQEEPPPTRISPEQLRAIVQEAAAFLDSCEQSLFMAVK
jgi:tetratricopeptide (TPR) repeat protein